MSKDTIKVGATDLHSCPKVRSSCVYRSLWSVLRVPTEEWGYDDDPVPSAVHWVSKTKFNFQLTSHKSHVHVLVALHVSHELREIRNIILSGEFTVFAVNRLANC